MQQRAMPFRQIIFVCTNVRAEGVCCGARHSVQLRDQLKAAVKERGLAAKIRVSQSGCQDRCVQGANVMVFPQNIWYAGVTADDIPTILERCVQSLASEVNT